MGFSGSLEHNLRADLSERVLLLHGLSGWPSPHGSYALCEVDLSTDGDPTGTPGNEKDVQFVIEAIPGTYTGLNTRGNNVRDDNSLQENQEEYKESDGELRTETHNLHGEGGPLDGDWKQREDSRVDEQAQPVLSSPSPESSTYLNLPPSGSVSIAKGQDASSFLTELAVLAPGVTICPASYETLVVIVRELQGSRVDCIKEQEKLKPVVNPGPLEHQVEQGVLESEDNQQACNGNDATYHERKIHPNLAPILGLLQGQSYLYVIYPALPFTFQSLLYFSPGALEDDLQIPFLIFQVLSAVAYSHKQGLIHGDLRPSNILLTDNLWCLVTGFLQSPKRNIPKSVRADTLSNHGDPVSRDEALGRRIVQPEPSIVDFASDLRKIIKGWWAGHVSNYDYLLLLNKLAGRRWADPCFHTVMPWVIDFSVKPDHTANTGWRDLTKSKWRLAKGDEQLDFTYASAEMPHHVSDECLSELAVCIYKARQLPLLVLRRIVRSVYEPNEYPANMQRLYQWTPDECIPEFYSDIHIFESIHPGMNSLAVPTWAKDAKEFIALHRDALESDRVSSQIHHWIDLTFGYKLSGEAAVTAKNVTLSTVAPSVPRSSGRRQLFSKPHPRRQHSRGNANFDLKVTDSQRSNNASEIEELDPLENTSALSDRLKTGLTSEVQGYDSHLSEPVSTLEALEEVSSFSESARHLSPYYKVPSNFKGNGDGMDEQNQERNWDSLEGLDVSPQSTGELRQRGLSPYNMSSFSALLDDAPQYQKVVESLQEEADDEDDLYESLWSMQKNTGPPKRLSVGEGEDVFAIGCMLAELYLKRPLFDPSTTSLYKARGIIPDVVECLPSYVQFLVKSTLEKDLSRKPTAAELLESPFFSSTVRAVYFFLAPLRLLKSKHERLRYMARMASGGAFVSMGHAAAEMCTSSTLSLIFPPYEDIAVDAVIMLITKLLEALKPHTSKRLLVPVVQRLLQSQQFPQLKEALLKLSFVKELWKVVGTGAYLQSIHLAVLGSLRRVPSRGLASAASKVLVSMCLNLGVPITLHQTVLPLLQAFGRDITVDHIDVLVGIGERMGETLVVKHLLPPLRTIIESNTDLLVTEELSPVHGWRLLAMVDAMAVLDRLRSILRPGVVLRELLQEPHNVYTRLLLRLKLSPNLLQCAAKALLLLCDYVGAEAAVSCVLPQLKQLFDGLVFAGKLESSLENGKASSRSKTKSIQGSPLLGNQENLECSSSEDRPQLFLTSGARSGGSSVAAMTQGPKVEDHILLVHILYPGLASLVGIERLRQGLTTWLLLEQALLKHCSWKWEGSDVNESKNSEKNSSSETGYETLNPANLLLDGVGWSTPLSQSGKWNKSPASKRTPEVSNEKLRSVTEFDIGQDEGSSWSWFASKGALWDAEGFGRIGAVGLTKDDHSWGLNTTILDSWRAHNGLIRSTILAEDENTIFTAGGGPRGGSVVREWKLSTQECVMEYSGHEEAVNDICILPGNGRLASCDGTIHIWNAHSGQRVALFDESTTSPLSSSSSAPSSGVTTDNVKTSVDVQNGNGASTSTYSLAATLTGGGLYNRLHVMEAEERLLGGMVNGSLRFFDIERGRQLHSWRFGQMETSLSSLVSAIASSGQGDSMDGRRYSQRSSWIAAGFGSGRCHLVDYRSGTVVGQWRAHDSFITKLYSLEEHYLISSSLDKTIGLWDLRRGASPECLQVFRGHKHGVTSFAVKGCDLLSAAGRKIGLSCLSRTAMQAEERHLIQPQKIYTAERGTPSLSKISTIGVLPFSQLFLIGTDDGHLKICS
ncbi:unnamed protein product [Calypogeia fissa]